MRTIRTKVYKFNELSKEAKESAIDSYRNIDNTDYQFVWDCTKDDAKEAGLKIISIDDHRPNKGEFITSAPECAEAIKEQHGSNCETYKTACTFLNALAALTDPYENIENTDEEAIEELEDEFLKSLLEDYRIIYNADIEYQNSDEAIKETIEANEYEFTADGKMI